MSRLVSALVLVALFLNPSQGLGVGHDHQPGKLHRANGSWSNELLDLINTDGRVHGHWYNQSDEFFYQGDTKALNGFLERAAVLKNPSLVVTVHAGSERRSALWGTKKPQLPYDWKLLVTYVSKDKAPDLPLAKGRAQQTLSIDVWIDRQVQLERIEIPEGVRVLSGGEIEKFISAQKQRDEVNKDEKSE